MKTILKKGLALATSAFVLVSTGGAFPAHPMEALASNEPAQSAIFSTDELTENIIPDSMDLPDNDELFAGYVEKVFSSENGISTFSNDFAGSRLSGQDKIVYDKLKEKITLVANGEQPSTEFSVQISDLSEKLEYTAEELECPLFTDDNKPNQAAADSLCSKLNSHMQSIIDALLVDCPYELYWYNKTVVVNSQFPKINYKSDNGGCLYFNPESVVTFQFPVDTAYSGSEPYTTDTSKTGQAKKAAANAQEIVKAAAALSDYQKLVYYRQEICKLTEYDHVAADSGLAASPAGINPWQLIYVFDNDPDTNVVCEGYAKAFQYLCDETEFQDKSIHSIIVTGIMTGATGAGPHMWNVVHMGNGNNYLVDVTNCDENSVGADDKLFLTGYTTGSVDDGYTIEIPFEIPIPELASAVTYQYDKDEYTDIVAIYGIENITLVQGGTLKESDLSTGEACEHNYEAAFNWADDHKSCTATLTCQKDKTHVVSGLACTVTSTIKTPATCAAKGITSYTAKVEYAGKTYEDSKEIEDIEKNPSNHTGNTEVRNKKEATSTADGYTGDTYCKDCGVKISSGTTIPATGSSSSGGSSSGGSSTPGGGSSFGGGGASGGSSTSGGNSTVPGGSNTSDGSNKPSDKPVIATKEDGSFTETTVSKTKNEQNNDVTVTTVVSKDAEGKVTGSEIKSVIHTEGAEITVAVKKDANGKTESVNANASVTGKAGSADKTTATLSADTAKQVAEAAGTKNVDVKYTVRNAQGEKAYTVTVNAADLTQGNKLFVVYVSSAGETILVNAKEYVVKNNGSVSISMSEKYAYQLITEEKMDQVSRQILKTVTSAKKQTSIEKDAATNMKLSSKANKKNIKSIKYSSSKSSVAKVDKNGKVKGVKKGTAIIKAKVTLKNGVVKTVKMKVTVK